MTSLDVGVDAARGRLAILDVEADIDEVFARLGQLERVFRHHLRQQGRLAQTGIVVETELDLAVPPRRQTGAKFQRVALLATDAEAVIDRVRAVILDFQLAEIDLIRRYHVKVGARRRERRQDCQRHNQPEKASGHFATSTP